MVFFSFSLLRILEIIHCGSLQTAEPNKENSAKNCLKSGRYDFICTKVYGNRKIYVYAQDHGDFYVNDLDFLASDFGITKWNDSYAWNMYKYCMPLIAIV